MSYELEGEIKLIDEVQTFGSGFQKREFVVTTNEKFPQDIKLECTKDKIELLDGLGVGDRVKVSFNLRGNEYKNRYYVNLQAWRIESESTAPTSQQEQGELSDSGDTDNLDDLEESPF